MKDAVKRAAVSLGAAGLLGATLLTGTASASDAPAGEVRFCVEGNYAAALEIHPADLGGGMTTPGFKTHMITPGNCVTEQFATQGVNAPVDVWGTSADGSPFHVGAASYNSDNGLGITTQGTADAPTLAVW